MSDRTFGWDLPPGVTVSDIERQAGDDTLCAECESHNVITELMMFNDDQLISSLAIAGVEYDAAVKLLGDAGLLFASDRASSSTKKFVADHKDEVYAVYTRAGMASDCPRCYTPDEEPDRNG